MRESKEQFMIGAAQPGAGPAVLAEKLKLLEEHPQTDVVQVQGTPEAPTLLVAETGLSHAELKETLGDGVTVEKNPPLEML